MRAGVRSDQKCSTVWTSEGVRVGLDQEEPRSRQSACTLRQNALLRAALLKVRCAVLAALAETSPRLLSSGRWCHPATGSSSARPLQRLGEAVPLHGPGPSSSRPPSPLASSRRA
eukprot:1671860-Heterocapsa_arctica.AAC.1